MRIIPLSEVVIPPNRQRRAIDPEALAELVSSIAARGLLHAPVLRDGGVLSAGERRIEAVRFLAEQGQTIRHDGEVIPLGSIPYTLVGDLSPLEAAETELEENIRRVDLSWQDKVRAIEEIAALKRAARPEITLPELSAQIYATKAGGDNGRLTEDLSLAGNLTNPAVAGAKTRKEAITALKHAVRAEQYTKLAAAVPEQLASRFRLIRADAFEWMADAPAEWADVILTDPPYGMGADAFGDSDGAVPMASHGYADSSELGERILAECPALWWRIARPNAHLYAFCDIDTFPRWKAALAAAGWRVFRTPLTWIKPGASGRRVPWPEHGPRRSSEWCVYAVKGDKRVRAVAPDWLSYLPDDNLGHSAQKPVALYQDLLARSALPGEHVLDPFCGSGTIFPAAHAARCLATGVELSPEAAGIAATRLKELV